MHNIHEARLIQIQAYINIRLYTYTLCIVICCHFGEMKFIYIAAFLRFYLLQTIWLKYELLTSMYFLYIKIKYNLHFTSNFTLIVSLRNYILLLRIIDLLVDFIYHSKKRIHVIRFYIRVKCPTFYYMLPWKRNTCKRLYDNVFNRKTR